MKPDEKLQAVVDGGYDVCLRVMNGVIRMTYTLKEVNGSKSPHKSVKDAVDWLHAETIGKPK
jgi:hypothetical protein